MNGLEKKFLDILEENGITVGYCWDNGHIDLNFYSEAGEDFWFTVGTPCFAWNFMEYAEDFDPEEHASMWLKAKENGMNGVPGLRELVEDAYSIKEFLGKVASELMNA